MQTACTQGQVLVHVAEALALVTAGEDVLYEQTPCTYIARSAYAPICDGTFHPKYACKTDMYFLPREINCMHAS